MQKIHRAKILDMNAEYWGTPASKLMEKAGSNAAKFLLKNYPKVDVFQFFCGSGNNGGDGFVAARKLLEWGRKVEVFLVKEPKTDLSRENLSRLDQSCVRDMDEFIDKKNNLIIDCLLGVGIQGDVRQDILEVIEVLNKSSNPKVAFDVSTGSVFQADLILSFHGSKPENRGFKEEIISIGMPSEAEEYFGPGDVFGNFPRRYQSSHKKQNGKILIIGGNEDFHGAPLLNFLGANAIGVDLISLFVPPKNVEISKAFSPEMFVNGFRAEHLSSKDIPSILQTAKDCDACLLGSGLGKKSATLEAVVEILDQISIPCAVDADAIQDLSAYKGIPENSVFLPHEKEFERLNISKDFPHTVLRKGKVDFIYQSGKTRKSATGTPILSKGGSGDFLAGMTVALLSRRVPGFEGAGMSTFLLGIAAERYEKKFGESLCFYKMSEIISKLVAEIVRGDTLSSFKA